jgi:hypothetical protein
MKYISILLLTIVMYACSSMKAKDGLPGLALEDCMPERKTVESIKDIEGKMVMIADQWMIEYYEGNSRLTVCNLPKFEFKAGLKVKFSADLKEVQAHERWAGTPGVLTSFEYKD